MPQVLFWMFLSQRFIFFSGVCYGAVNGQHKSFELHHVGKSRFLQVVTGCWQNEQMGKLLAQFWTILVFIQAQGFICLLLFTHPLVFRGKNPTSQWWLTETPSRVRCSLRAAAVISHSCGYRRVNYLNRKKIGKKVHFLSSFFLILFSRINLSTCMNS